MGGDEMPAIRFTKGRARVYLKAINNWKKKTMSVEELSLEVGIYEDVIRDQLASFDPLIRIMVDVDVIALKPELEKYIAAKTVKRKTTRRKKPHPKYKQCGGLCLQKYDSAWWTYQFCRKFKF